MFQSIFQVILNNLPPDPTGVIITSIVAVGIGLGALTALLGALHSRPTMALIMLATGSVLGYVLSAWYAWGVDPSIAIATGAILLGILGFVLHRFCVAFALGILVAGVSAITVFDYTQGVDKPTADQVQTTPNSIGQILQDRWQTAPPAFRGTAPWVAVIAFAAAAALSFAFPKFGMAALYSLGGTILTLLSIGLGHSTDKIHWLDSLKTGPMTVASLGMAMLLVGFLAQIGLLYRPPSNPDQAAEAQREKAEAI